MNNDLMNQAKNMLDRAIDKEKVVKKVIESIGPAIVESLRPVIEESLANIKLTINPQIQMPDMKQPDVHVNVPDVYVPEPKVTVNIPETKAPQVNVTVPTRELSKTMDKHMGEIKKAISEQKPIDLPMQTEYTMKKPMPVLITDMKGQPWSPLSGRSEE